MEPLPEEEVRGKMLGDFKTRSCPFGWATFGSRCFVFHSGRMAWVDAEKYCLRYGANLASIHNLQEYEFVQEVVRNKVGHFPEAWIGGNHAVKDFVWLWSDGSSFNHRDWSIGEPNNNGKCIVMNYSVSSGIQKKRPTKERRESNLEGQSRGPWLVGSRRFSPSKRTPRRRQRRRKVRPPTRRPPLRPRWSTPAPSAGHRCRIPKPSSSTLRANTPSPPCLPSWRTFKHEELLTDLDLNPNPNLDTL